MPGAVEAARAALGDDSFAAASARGAALTLDEIVVLCCEPDESESRRTSGTP